MKHRDKKRLPTLKAVVEIEKILNNLQNGAHVYKVLATLAALRGDFCVEELE